MWQTLIASVFYTLTVIMMGMFFFGYDLFQGRGMDIRWNMGAIEIAGVFAAQGFLFSSVKSLLFDLNNGKYKAEYAVGPIRFGRWKKLPNIEYVSIFRQLKVKGYYTYEVNIWMKANKSFTIYESGDFETAFAMGENTAKTLDVDLLDATVPNDYKWVNL